MITRITLKRLPLENLKRKPFRTAALVIVVMMLTLAFFGGSLLSMNLRNGLRSMQERMGADLMVVPQDTGAKAEALLTNGGSNTFYFTNDIENLVSKLMASPESRPRRTYHRSRPHAATRRCRS